MTVQELIDTFVNDLLENAPDAWDDDVAGEAIAVRYLRHLEAEVGRLGGCLLPWCRWGDGEYCDHGYVGGTLYRPPHEAGEPTNTNETPDIRFVRDVVAKIITTMEPDLPWNGRAVPIDVRFAVGCLLAAGWDFVPPGKRLTEAEQLEEYGRLVD